MSEGETIITITYALIGVTGALAVVVFVWGFATYITKIGLPSDLRNPGIKIMAWSVRLILTAVALIVILNYLKQWFG